MRRRGPPETSPDLVAALDACSRSVARWNEDWFAAEARDNDLAELARRDHRVRRLPLASRWSRRRTSVVLRRGVFAVVVGVFLMLLEYVVVLLVSGNT